MNIVKNRGRTKNKIIFFFVGSLKVGGAEMVATRIKNSLTEKGYNVRFLLLKNTVELPVQNPEQDILHLNTQKFNNKLIKILYAYYGIWKYYIKYRPRRIISFSSGLNILLLISLVPGQVLRVDTNLFWVSSKLYRRKFLKLVGFIPQVKRVIVPSKELNFKFKEYVGNISFRKFVTIYNPVVASNKKIIEPNSLEFNEKFFISVGRLQRFKGFEQLINCFANAKFNEDISLYILGSGDMKSKLEKKIGELGMEKKIKLFGFVKHPEVLVSRAEALILNSTFECFPNVLLEGLFLGVPVISNDCDYGPREIIEDRVNGLLYDQTDDDNLIKTLEEFVNSKTLRVELKNNTSQGLYRFETQKITQEWITKILN
jgi:glycosyltransferase involved in cell wall biosynthesis